MTVVRDCACLSRSRRKAIKLAIAVASPIFGKVDKSPDGNMPSSSNKTLVGNLFYAMMQGISFEVAHR